MPRDLHPVAARTLEPPQPADFDTRLAELMQRLHGGGNFYEIMPHVEADLLDLLNAERITLYQRSRTTQEIVSKYHSGADVKEIHEPLSVTSIAGFVALSQRALCIDDVHDAAALRAVHPSLRYDTDYEKQSGFRIQSMIAIPIKYHNILLGVMQVMNRRGGGAFAEAEMNRAKLLAGILAQKFRYDLSSTTGPYEYLIRTSRLARPDLVRYTERAQKEHTSVTELLLAETTLTPAEIGASLERYYQVPFMAYDPNLVIPRHLLDGMNDAYLRKQRWVPLSAGDQSVEILIDDPSDLARVAEIQRVVPAQDYRFRVGLPGDILRYLGLETNHAAKDAHLDELLGQLEKDQLTLEVDHSNERSEVDENEATVIRLVNRLIVEAYESGASDIHVEPSKDTTPSVVRLRIDGVCQKTASIPATHIRAVVSRIKIMSRLDISEHRKPQDGKLVVKYKGRPLELRVATLPTVNGESVVMRILATNKPLPLDKLNLSERNLQELEKILEHPHGIFLVVGPTGSGKTTTLHAVLGHINTADIKIWTAEDPVEITQPGLQQMQVQPKIGLTFAMALRAFLRADPDVIMIGEMRDQETAQAAIEASLTGHLVMSTLHTNSAAETVVRLLDLGLDPVNFSDALLGVLAQRLVRVLCEHCKQPYTPDAQEIELMRHYYGAEHFDELGISDSLTLYRPVGCEACKNTGYHGRTGVYELLVATPAMKEMVYRRATATDMRLQAMREGMRTLMQDGIAKLVRGQTDLAQVRAVAAE